MLPWGNICCMMKVSIYNRAVQGAIQQRGATMGFYTRTLRDYDGEDTSFRVNALDLTELNIAAELVKQANFGTAVNGITTGSLQKIAYGNQVDSDQAAPANVWSQRELKWRVDYRDTVTGSPHHITIGTADATKLDPNNKDRAYIGDGAEVDAFVTNFEDYVLSPAGNAVEVMQITMVGRNI